MFKAPKKPRTTKGIDLKFVYNFVMVVQTSLEEFVYIGLLPRH